MRGRQADTELVDLDSGLTASADPYSISDLLTRDVEDLAQEVEKVIRYTAISMIQAGRIFYAIKHKLSHGEWEPFVMDRGWSWHYVRTAMKLVDVAAKFPQVIHLPPGRATQRLLDLPLSQIESVLAGLPAAAVQKLTPWELESAYGKKKLEESRAREANNRKHREAPPLVLPPEPEWKEFSEYWDTVYHTVQAMQNWLAKHSPLPDHFYDQISKHTLAGKMSEHCGNLVLMMYPQEESEKRTPIVHAKGFASR